MIEVLLLILFLLMTVASGSFFFVNARETFSFLKLPLYFIAGFTLISSIAFLGGFLHIPLLASLIVPILLTCLQLKNIRIPRFVPTKNTVFLCFFILLSSAVLVFLTFFQFYSEERGLRIQGSNTHDALWHVALQESIKQSIPPKSPIYQGNIIRGYHYLSDIYWAIVSVATGVSTLTLYLNVSPILFASLFASTTYLLLNKLFKKTPLVVFGCILIMFGSSMAYAVQLLFPQAQAGQSVFWLDQSTSYFINQQFLLSLSIVNVIYFLLLSSTKKWSIHVGALLGALAVIKIYAFLLLLPSIGLVGLVEFFRKKDTHLLKSCVIATALAALFLSLTGNNLGFPFIFAPGWFVRTMFEATDRLHFDTWEIHRQLFVSTKNYLRLSLHWLYGFGVFMFGNFGPKILGFLFLPLALLIPKHTKNVKNESARNVIGLLFLVGAASLTTTMLVIQKGVVWNTIQFLHYIQLPIAVGVVLFLEQLKKRLAILLAVLLLASALPTTFLTLWYNATSNDYIFHPVQTLEEIEKLKALPIDSTLIVGHSFNGDSLVPALTKRPVSFADPAIVSILGYDSDTFQTENTHIELGLAPCQKGNYILTNTGYESTLSGKLVSSQAGFSLVECDQSYFKMLDATPSAREN